MDVVHEAVLRDQWGALRPEFLSDLKGAIGGQDGKQARTLTRELHAADLADVMEAIGSSDSIVLINLLGKNFDVEALAELDSGTRDAVVEELPPEVMVNAIKRLDTDDAVYLIEDLDRQQRSEILAKIPKEDRVALNRALDYPEDTAGRLMQTDYVAVPEFWNVEKVLDHTRATRGLPDDFSEIYVTNASFHLIGWLPLSRILRANRFKPVKDLMDDDQVPLKVTDTKEEVAYQFEQYNLVSAPVIDANGRLVGVLTVDDVVDIIQERAEDDMLRLGGVAASEELLSSVVSITRSRFSWLFVNLLTAILASWVISWFDATIQQMVQIAILMPIVASMGGNAGTQTMTVAVRALATRQLGPFNAIRVVFRECSVGLINGFLFALIMGLFTWWWFGFQALGLIIALAMIINLLAAALAGILLPLALDKLDQDPAVSAAVFLTTVTDVTGFFSFLGLATLWLKMGGGFH
ncbi:magnesium transporter [Aestuariivirga litoralis]|uniref:magnesium transporter n=1 Tax=Aestuariivirga litoralis TaxID=2650924 RepID=UPI0018C51760|nr:magnesium transporter [Aestuariivirga litoralis]MBG1231297.1 magnesium transporter [Aestuariivirga litoralis]